MAKKMTADLSFNRPLADAWALITSPAYQEGKLAAQGTRNVSVSIDEAADGSVTVVLKHENPVEGFAKKIVGDWISVVETQNWSAAAADGSRTANHSTEFVGQKTKFGGTLSLADKGNGAVLTVNAEVSGNVPMIGGKVEDQTIEETKKAIAAEEAFAATYSG